MRIAYVCADPGVRPSAFGGSAAHVRELVRSLVARGHDVTVFAAAAEGAAEVLPCPVVDLAADTASAALRSVVQKTARHAGDTSRTPREVQGLLLNQALAAALAAMDPLPDVVYERQSLWSVAGVDFAKRHGIPHLLEVNAPLVDQQKEYRELELAHTAEAIERLLVGASDRVLVTSPELAAWARARGAARRNVRVVPCGVTASMFARAKTLREARKADPSRFVVGFVGSLKPWHGLDVLLAAFRQLHKADACYRLLIVGDGPLRGEVERTLRTTGLDAYSELAGDVHPDEVPSYLARMDVGVAPYPELPSFYFSPLKLWEYAAAGLPIAAAAIGHLPGLFPHREAALLHSPGSVRKLVAHIEKLRAQPELAARLARRARRIAKTHTWDRIAARVEKIAADAVGQRRGRQ